MSDSKHCWLCGGECRCNETPVYKIKWTCDTTDTSLVDELVAALSNVLLIIDKSDYYNDGVLKHAEDVLEKARKRYD